VKFEKDPKLYELQKDLHQSLGKGEDLNSHKLTDDAPSLFDGNGEGLSFKENEIHPQY